ncbi:MAG: hypothetical protein GYB32_01095 [Algicola sp.]|nr:hypothetical protein [Algicola sp.]
MKKIYLPISLMFLCLCFSCTNESLNDDLLESNRKQPKFDASAVTETVITTSEDDDEHCVETNLMAGQHHVAGTVTVDIDGDNLVITYSSNGDWTIGTTHLSIGNCDEEWAPLTGSGNPQIGQFEYTEPDSVTPYEVVYIISLAELDDNYCFAAHAEVEGPTGGETAWAEGEQFSGRGWAMYVDALLSECEDQDDDDDNNGGGTPY